MIGYKQNQIRRLALIEKGRGKTVGGNNYVTRGCGDGEDEFVVAAGGERRIYWEEESG